MRTWRSHVQNPVVGADPVVKTSQHKRQGNCPDCSSPWDEKMPIFTERLDGYVIETRSPIGGSSRAKKLCGCSVEIRRHDVGEQHVAHAANDCLMNFACIASEAWRLTNIIGCHLDNSFLVVHLKDAPPSTDEYDRHVRGQRHVDGDRSERLPIVNDAVLLRCLKDRVEAVVLNEAFALAAKQERTVPRLLDQCGVGSPSWRRSRPNSACSTERNGPRSHRVA